MPSFAVPCRNLRRAARFTLGAALLGASMAAAQTPPPGLPNEGVLRLQLGATDRLVWETPSTTDTDPTQPIFDRRDLTNRSQDRCLLQLGAVGSAPNLLQVSAGVPTSNEPGFGSDSIGVFGGGGGSTARGTDCYRVGANESLTLTLAGALSGRQVYRTELDIETKQNARIRATARLGNTTSVWELRSGGSVVAGAGSTTPGAPIFNCTSSSDSGSDSGPSDNCRWVIGGLWDSLELVTLAGEWSLEGGADFGAQAGANNSLFFLTRASGVLDCGDTTITTGDGVNDARVTGFRLGNADGTACVPIPYLLESNGNSVRFEKDLLGQTDAAIVFTIDWLQEAASFPITPTLQFFGNSTTPIVIDLCVGTPIPGGDPANLTALDLSAFAPNAIDQDPNLADIQYGCLLSEKVDYVDTDTIKVTQLIYLRGDWACNR
jgi:hypothetical protein